MIRSVYLYELVLGLVTVALSKMAAGRLEYLIGSHSNVKISGILALIVTWLEVSSGVKSKIAY